MDSAARNFFALVGICAVLGAYAVWGFIAYVAIPLFGVNGGAFGRLAAACVPARAHPRRFTRNLRRPGGGTLRRQIAASRRLSRRHSGCGATADARAASGSEADRVSSGGWRWSTPRSRSPSSTASSCPESQSARASSKSSPHEELRAALEHERYHVRNLDPIPRPHGKGAERGILPPAVAEGAARPLRGGSRAGRRPARRARLWPSPAPRRSAEGAGRARLAPSRSVSASPREALTSWMRASPAWKPGECRHSP